VGRRYALLFVLYFCQGLPGGFLAVVLPVVLREQGLDLTTIGLASALSLPWGLKVLWSPLVDRFGSQRFGWRRSWIVPAQLGMLATTIAFIWVRPEDSLFHVVVLFLVLNTLAATQDVAVDGWAVELLDEKDLGPGNAAQVGGFKLGNIVGGGVLVGLIGVIGWGGDFMVMASLIASALVFVLFTEEKPRPRPVAREPFLSGLSRLARALLREGPVFWAFIVFAKFGESFAGAMTKPMLFDHGFSKETIGLVDGFAGGIATVLGAALCGLLVHRRSWHWALVPFSILQGVALVCIGIYQTGVVGVEAFAAMNAVECFAGGGVAVCIFALAMGRTDREVGAAHFTAVQVTYMSGAMLAAPLAGLMGDLTSYLHVMVSGGAMAIVLGLCAPAVGRRFAARMAA
jgi:PAT family beta-lactamase induction signal transducer AmpG